jgi:hypothetical protein
MDVVHYVVRLQRLPTVEAGEDVSAQYLVHVYHMFHCIGVPPTPRVSRRTRHLPQHMVSYD